MKFRNPKTGDVYDSMARTPCPHDGDCGACKYKPFVGESCADFCREHPIEAARMMGFEVVEEKEEPMEKTDKPRFTEEEAAAAKMLLGAGAVSVYKDEHGALRWKSGENVDSLRNMLPAKLFPSLRPGQSVELKEIEGE